MSFPLNFDSTHLNDFIAKPAEYVLRCKIDSKAKTATIKIEEKGILTYFLAHWIKPQEYKLNAIFQSINTLMGSQVKKPPPDPILRDDFIATLGLKKAIYLSRHPDESFSAAPFLDNAIEQCNMLSKTKETGTTAPPLTGTSAPQTQPAVVSGGIFNGGNSCYLDALVQALRACNTSREFVQKHEDIDYGAFSNACVPRQLQKHQKAFASFFNVILKRPAPPPPEEGAQEKAIITNWMKKQLAKLFDKLDNGQTITRNEINAFRNDLIRTGLEAGAFSQEDAAEACEYLQDALEMDTFPVKKSVEYNLKLIRREGTYPAFEPKIQPHRAIYVPLPQSKEEVPLNALITNAEIEEEIEPHRIIPPPKPSEISKTGPSPIAEPVAAKEAPLRIHTHQSFQLEQNNPPKLLRICLNRFANNEKLDNPVKIPHALNISTIEKPKETIPYQLKSIVLHLGAKSPHGGHYIAMAPKIEEGQRVWYVYNDSQTTRYPAEELFMQQYGDLIATQSYITFYEIDPNWAPPQKIQPNNPTPNTGSSTSVVKT